MLKLFISQPMNGMDDKKILEERKKAIETVQDKVGEPVSVIDSFFQDIPDDVKPLWYLGKSLQEMSKADIVYFADGWEDARGCKIEHLCAQEYNIKIMEEKSMKRTSQEITSMLEDLVENKEDDRYISLLEDVADSVAQDTSRKEAEEWKKKYEDCEREWKEKYRARFMEGGPEMENVAPETEPEVEGKVTFEDLFEEA